MSKRSSTARKAKVALYFKANACVRDDDAFPVCNVLVDREDTNEFVSELLCAWVAFSTGNLFEELRLKSASMRRCRWKPVKMTRLLVGAQNHEPPSKKARTKHAGGLERTPEELFWECTSKMLADWDLYAVSKTSPRSMAFLLYLGDHLLPRLKMYEMGGHRGGLDVYDEGHWFQKLRTHRWNADVDWESLPAPGSFSPPCASDRDRLVQAQQKAVAEAQALGTGRLRAPAQLPAATNTVPVVTHSWSAVYCHFVGDLPATRARVAEVAQALGIADGAAGSLAHFNELVSSSLALDSKVDLETGNFARLAQTFAALVRLQFYRAMVEVADLLTQIHLEDHIHYKYMRSTRWKCDENQAVFCPVWDKHWHMDSRFPADWELTRCPRTGYSSVNYIHANGPLVVVNRRALRACDKSWMDRKGADAAWVMSVVALRIKKIFCDSGLAAFLTPAVRNVTESTWGKITRDIHQYRDVLQRFDGADSHVEWADFDYFACADKSLMLSSWRLLSLVFDQFGGDRVGEIRADGVHVQEWLRPQALPEEKTAQQKYRRRAPELAKWLIEHAAAPTLVRKWERAEGTPLRSWATFLPRFALVPQSRLHYWSFEYYYDQQQGLRETFDRSAEARNWLQPVGTVDGHIATLKTKLRRKYDRK